MALAYARFAATKETSGDAAPDRDGCGIRELMAGTGRVCTDLMAAWPGRLVAKIGADGIYCAALPEPELGIALKVEDGDMRRLSGGAARRAAGARRPGSRSGSMPSAHAAGRRAACRAVEREHPGHGDRYDTGRGRSAFFMARSCGEPGSRHRGQEPILMAKQDTLDPPTLHLVRFAAAIAQGYEPELRERAAPLRTAQVPVAWVEELLLQSVLMVGYPRALIAFGVWRKVGGCRRPPRIPRPTTATSPSGPGGARRPAPWSTATTTAGCGRTCASCIRRSITG